MGLDIGPDTLCQCGADRKTVLWNGPMGVFEMAAFANGTNAVAAALAKASADSGAFTLIGVAIPLPPNRGPCGPSHYVSTGGGAMIECLEGKVLPGTAAIRDDQIQRSSTRSSRRTSHCADVVHRRDLWEMNSW